MSFMVPRAKAAPVIRQEVPPPPPAPPVQPIKAEGTRSAQEKERLRRKKGTSSTILTGPRGLLPEQMPVSTPSLLAGS